MTIRRLHSCTDPNSPTPPPRPQPQGNPSFWDGKHHFSRSPRETLVVERNPSSALPFRTPRGSAELGASRICPKEKGTRAIGLAGGACDVSGGGQYSF